MAANKSKPAAPGSDEAIKTGCLCPSTDNLKGEGIFITEYETGSALYWMQAGCPLHGRPEADSVEIIVNPTPAQIEEFWTDK